ncbi:MAG: twin-arginine translocase subunit TatC [Candidatus Abyssobacteria bacterium SURF_17]|jgi:sec-independent protein translocase protein TatC|uniref:Sec-independent protein translocase protein TatC n=1 Tax=Candidatus Abyssobacteria bacterium SURF_17 TaxID=2093361 RepID=A0A419EZY6_9BACT|nr:MAG: twin-arginine translocase subunit TatC [Candidatus Abyssubacteria bacterium SURF_17]
MSDVKMTFTEHLAELRIRLVKGLIAFAVFTILGYVFRGYVLEIIKRPLGETVPLHAFDIFEPFFASLRIAVYTGVFFGLPFFVYQIMMFCLPALRPSEKRVIVGGLCAGVVLLYGGIVFSYVLILPLLMPQLSGFFRTGVEQTFSLNMYINKIFRFMIAFGLGFQMPIVLIILVRIGVISVDWLKKNRKYMIIGIFVVAAMLTPPDIISQTLLAIPLLLLYEVSIWVSVLLEGGGRDST